MELRARISALAEVMDEFRLSEASLRVDGVTVAFKRRAARITTSDTSTSVDTSAEVSESYAPEEVSAPAIPDGTPVASPMAGIFYNAPSPGSPPFVKEGDEVAAGQIIGLIEAMKVFNEIPSPIGGTILRLAAAPGQLVQPGDALVVIAP